MKTILYAEKKSFNYLLMEAILEDYDCNLVRAKNGQEAVNIVSNKNIDLIIMSKDMPELNGEEAAEKIRMFNKTIPIVHYSGTDTQRNDLYTDKFLKPLNFYIFDDVLKKYGFMKRSDLRPTG